MLNVVLLCFIDQKGSKANIDTETGNMQTVVKDDNVTLCLWANLQKNPRYDKDRQTTFPYIMTHSSCSHPPVASSNTHFKYLHMDSPQHVSWLYLLTTGVIFFHFATCSFRFKGLNFAEAGMGFELPKQLAVSNIAVRNLHTRYDHLSLLARITHLRIHTHSYRSLSDTALNTLISTISFIV